jgi:hypothetical protein
MADTPTGKKIDLFADTKSAPVSPVTPSFVAPTVEPVTELKVPVVPTIEDALKVPPVPLVSGKATTITSPTGLPKEDVSPSMTNLIDLAAKLNTALAAAKDKKFPDAHVVQVLHSNSDKVMQILKEGGMDTQQAERAHKLLMEL